MIQPEFHLADHFDPDRLADEIAHARTPALPAREHLKRVSAVLAEAFKQGADVRELVAARALLVDAVLAALWQGFACSRSRDLALIAVGGYGRGELHPHSDIDLLILSRGALQDEWREDLSSFVTLLWDLKLDIGQSVRSIQECVEAARDDVTILTNLLETRTISGDDALRVQLSRLAYSDEVCPDTRYFQVKRDEQRTRHDKYGDTEYNLEPNLKSSPGALRDIQTIGWITKRHFVIQDISELTRYNILTDEEFTSLRTGETFLWRLRFGLQLLADRNENRLLFDHQRNLASMLGYADDGDQLGVEVMMQDYYRTVLMLAELTEVILQHFEEAILRADEADEILPLNKRFQIHNHDLEAINNQSFAYAPYSLIEVFVLLAQNPQIKGIRASTIRALRAHRHLIDDDFRKNLAATTLFIELLRTPHDLHRTLTFMKKYDILGRYLPEFGRIVGQMQHDLFHIYTVDAHTLRVIYNMVNLRMPSARTNYPLASRLIHHLPKAELLYIAGLYHDIAKGRGGDHSELGATDAQNFCRRHHLSERDTQLVSWLVEHHLLMSMTAQRKDIADPDIILTFAQQLPSGVHLDYLYVLTACDISATNPRLWNTWRASLLRQLYIEARRALRRGLEQPIDRNQWVQATQAETRELLAAQGFSNAQIDRIWETLDEDLFLQDSTVDIAWQTASIIRHGDSPAPLVLMRDTKGGPTDGFTQIVIYVPMRMDLFAATTALLEQLNLNIVDARISSSQGPFSLSTYVVIDEQGQPLGKDPARKQRVQEKLTAALADPEDFPQIIHRRASRQLKHFAFPTEVVLSNDTINQRTLIEVVTPDRPGLLARIGRIFLDFQILLVSAKIATLGERVEDAFFVTDQQGRALSDPHVCQDLQVAICQQLDEIAGT